MYNTHPFYFFSLPPASLGIHLGSYPWDHFLLLAECLSVWVWCWAINSVFPSVKMCSLQFDFWRIFLLGMEFLVSCHAAVPIEPGLVCLLTRTEWAQEQATSFLCPVPCPLSPLQLFVGFFVFCFKKGYKYSTIPRIIFSLINFVLGQFRIYRKMEAMVQSPCILSCIPQFDLTSRMFRGHGCQVECTSLGTGPLTNICALRSALVWVCGFWQVHVTCGPL